MVEKRTTLHAAATFQPRAVESVPPEGLVLDRAIRDEIVGHLRSVLPAEGCGLLATRIEQLGQPERAERFYPGTNLEASATSYTMDPGEVVTALRDIDANGWRLGAIVHSHPVTPPSPSETDLRLAYYPGALMLIISFAVSPPEIRAWRVASDNGTIRLSGESLIEIRDMDAS